MTALDYLRAFMAAVAEHPMFWGVLMLSLFFVVACSMACFAKKPVRALICGALAFECAWFISMGYVG